MTPRRFPIATAALLANARDLVVSRPSAFGTSVAQSAAAKCRLYAYSSRSREHKNWRSAQSVAFANERPTIDIARRRLDASVLLVKALGGLWDGNVRSYG